jgi:hypothetical protein
VIGSLLIGVAVWAAVTLATLALVAALVISLPVTYLETDARRAWPNGWRAVLVTIARNVAGLVLIAVGLVLSLPGVPGQGVLTVLAGVMLTDFPARRRLERRLCARPAVLAALNRLRAAFGRPPLRPVPGPPPPAAARARRP